MPMPLDRPLENPILPALRFRDFGGRPSLISRFRNIARDGSILALSAGRSIARTSDWIRFPYYHHVFDDECHGFSRQLKYLKNFGDFISLDDAVAMLESGNDIKGRYFCITFDDGFKNCEANAMPILLDHGAPAAFFLATDYIGTDIEADREHLLDFFGHRQTLVEFLTWSDCRRMIDSGMTIGSHTVHHARLADLQAEEVLKELIDSKAVIEEHLGIICEHFCYPFGISNNDFLPERDPGLAHQAGYRSVSTGSRGAMRQGASQYMIQRDHILANWSNFQLRYFLSR
jgi:peptidoglycan/xylan/chitin deacetylase (PgdA/CDA1 family)